MTILDFEKNVNDLRYLNRFIMVSINEHTALIPLTGTAFKKKIKLEKIVSIEIEERNNIVTTISENEKKSYQIFRTERI